MRPGRIVALVTGFLLLAPGIGMLFGGGGAALVATQRDAEGFATTTVALASPRTAITTDDLAFRIDPGTPRWMADAVDLDVRLGVVEGAQDVFVGIGPADAVDRWLTGVSHDQVQRVTVVAPGGANVTYRDQPGADGAPAPAGQSFWVATATGPGGEDLAWTATDGAWTGVVMNADGSPGVVADLEVGLRADALLPGGLTLLALGVLVLAAAVFLIVFGATGPRRHDADPTTTAPGDPTVAGVANAPVPHPVSVQARLDPALSRWQWLVKWALAIPHFIVLAALWALFVVLTIVAGVSILFTGTYPRGIFDFNVGVLRWSWRVTYYATTGGIGTDRYPPFSLESDPDYPADLDVAYPPHLSRGLVLVKWWLLALPQYLVLALLLGTIQWYPDNLDGVSVDPTGGAGLLGLLVLVAGIVLLVRGAYPRTLFDLVVGLNRWIFRVVAYAALMTDTYPPFRLDQGGSEPSPPPPTEPPTPPATTPPPLARTPA